MSIQRKPMKNGRKQPHNTNGSKARTGSFPVPGKKKAQGAKKKVKKVLGY